MKKMISNIVFTKNRPLQLEAYLESLYRFFPEDIIQTYIIYKPELFSDEYKLLLGKYPDCVVIEEKDFHNDCMKVINEADTKYILFGIDDVVYFDKVDFDVIDRTFDEHGDEILGFTLRFSPEADFLKNGGDEITTLEAANQKIFCLNWKQGQTPHSRYPFELCATIYKTSLVREVLDSLTNNNPLIRFLFSPSSILIKALGNSKLRRSILKDFGYFFSPNTLESWSCRWCQNNATMIPNWLYFQKLCASAIQVNLVNTSTQNDFDGSAEYTIEELNSKYKQGSRFDINSVVDNKPTETHSGREHFKLKTKEL